MRAGVFDADLHCQRVRAQSERMRVRGLQVHGDGHELRQRLVRANRWRWFRRLGPVTCADAEVSEPPVDSLTPCAIARNASQRKVLGARAMTSDFDPWTRLDAAEGAFGFRRACALLQAHLQPGSWLLDLAGGPGRYAIELARSGHHVALAGLSHTLLETARANAAEHGAAENIGAFAEVNATDLRRYPDGSFDAVGWSTVIDLGRLPEPMTSVLEASVEQLARDPAVVASCGHAVLIASKA